MTQRILTAELLVKLISIRDNIYYLVKYNNEYEVVREGRKTD
jgi:hypothetical protein